MHKIEKEHKEVIAKENEKLSEVEAFYKFIQEAKDFDPILNEICQRLKGFIGATGVYLAIRDLKRRKVNENDLETDHMIKDNEVIRYIAWDNDHSNLLKGRFLELESGVTNFLFKPPEEEDKKDDANKDLANVEEGTEKKVEEKLNQVKIDEVVREKRMKFFREPRLGCYRAIDITYKSSLSKFVKKMFKI